MTEEKKEGWCHLSNSRKWHYIFSDKRSACGQWALFGHGEFEQGNDESESNCAGCKKKVLAMKAKEAKKIS
jgi:hypothetical protein